MSEKNEFNQDVGLAVNHWHGVKTPSVVAMKGKFCTLEPIDVNRHAEKLFENLSIDNKGESWTYLPYGPFANAQEFCAWLKKTNAEVGTQLYVILDQYSSPVGVCGYLRTDPTHGVIEVGHLHYSSLIKRSPTTTEAMYLMMCHAFDHFGYRRYEWKCNSFNEPSKNAALRLGFKFEGTFRQHCVFKGRNRDTDWFSILDNEWPKVKQRLERWLDAANFDASGQQINSLSRITV